MKRSGPLLLVMLRYIEYRPWYTVAPVPGLK